MKHFLLVSILAVACGPAVVAAEPADARLARAPSEFSVEDWRGKVVLLDFWASWCGPCRESFPWMAEMQRRHADRDFVVVAVNLDEDLEPAARFLGTGDYEFHHVRDPEGRLAERFGLSVMPSSLLFDREGRPAYRHDGFRPEKTAEYEQHIRNLLDGTAGAEPIAISATRRRKLGVNPWERDVLAAAEMELINDPLEIEFDDHIYFSKEASSGGRGFGGGGCGCN